MSEDKDNAVNVPVELDNPFNDELVDECVPINFEDVGWEEYVLTFETTTELFRSLFKEIEKNKIFSVDEWERLFLEALFEDGRDEEKDACREPMDDDDQYQVHTFALRLAHTPPRFFGNDFSTTRCAMTVTSYSAPWLAANQLAGSQWIEAFRNETTPAANTIVGFFRVIVAKNKFRNLCREDVVDRIVENAEDKAEMDRLLLHFDTSTEYMKCVVALTIFARVKKISMLELALPWDREQLESWNWIEDIPLVPNLNRVETFKLREVWDNRGKFSTLRDDGLNQLSKIAGKVCLKRFLHLVRKGKQIFKDFAHMNPELPPTALKVLIDLKLRETVTNKDLTAAREAALATYRSTKKKAESRAKKAEASKKEKEAEEAAKKQAGATCEEVTDEEAERIMKE